MEQQCKQHWAKSSVRKRRFSRHENQTDSDVRLGLFQQNASQHLCQSLPVVFGVGLSDCPLSHGLFVLSHCPLPDCPIVLLFTGPSSPPSHGPIVPLPNVPLTNVRSSIVKCPIAAWSYCSLSHCPGVPLSIVPVSIVPLSDCSLSPASHGCIGLRRRGLQV